MSTDTTIMEENMDIPESVKMNLLYDPAFPFVGILTN